VRKLSLLALSLLLAGALGCSHISTVRLQPDAIAVEDGLRPIAGVQADAMSLYLLFIPIPGVNLDKVINQMLVVAAKTIGADKIANLRFDIDPDGGIWAIRKIAWMRSARASGIAVQVTAPEADPGQDDGPEGPTPPSTVTPTSTQ
jgi:hypothetical protein